MTSPDAASVVDILDQLIDIVRSARSVPMSASAMVNRSQVIELLTTARDILPDQLVEADGLLAEVDSVTARAHDEAARIRERAEHDAEDIVAQAREQAARLVSQDAVTVAAKSQAQRIVDDATNQAEAMKKGADEYSDERLRELQDQVAELGNSMDGLSRKFQGKIDVVLGQVKAGRRVIAERQGEIDPVDEGMEYEEDSWT